MFSPLHQVAPLFGILLAKLHSMTFNLYQEVMLSDEMTDALKLATNRDEFVKRILPFEFGRHSSALGNLFVVINMCAVVLSFVRIFGNVMNPGEE